MLSSERKGHPTHQTVEGSSRMTWTRRDRTETCPMLGATIYWDCVGQKCIFFVPYVEQKSRRWKKIDKLYQIKTLKPSTVISPTYPFWPAQYSPTKRTVIDPSCVILRPQDFAA